MECMLAVRMQDMFPDDCSQFKESFEALPSHACPALPSDVQRQHLIASNLSVWLKIEHLPSMRPSSALPLAQAPALPLFLCPVAFKLSIRAARPGIITDRINSRWKHH